MRNIATGSRNIFSLLAADQVQARPGQCFKRRKYAFFTAELVLSGSGWLSVGGRYYDAQAGDMYILPPGQDHEYAADRREPWRKIFFNAGGTLTIRLMECYSLTRYHFSGWEECRLFTQMWELYRLLSPEAHREAALHFHRLVALAAGESEDQPSAAEQARRFIHDNLQNRIRLADIAQAAFLSPSQLTRLFRAETGCTPYDYLCRERIAMAEHLLRCTDLPVGEIADRLQFADAFYFSSCFKRATGLSPRQYRLAPPTTAKT